MKRKRGTRFLAALLAASVLLSLTPALAFPDIFDLGRWPDPKTSGKPNVIQREYEVLYSIGEYGAIDYPSTGFVNQDTWNKTPDSPRFPYLAGAGEKIADGTILWHISDITVPNGAVHKPGIGADNGYAMTLSEYRYKNALGRPDNSELLKMWDKTDFYFPVLYFDEFTHNGILRRTPNHLIATKEATGYNAAKIEEAMKRVPRFVELFHKANALSNKIMAQPANEIKPGGYHPIYANMLYSATNRVAQVFYSRVPGATEPLTRALVEQKFLALLKNNEPKSCKYEPGQLDGLLDTLEYFINFAEEHRIDVPDITSFRLAGSPGIIDKGNHTVTVYLPGGFDLATLTATDAVVVTNGWTHATLGGSFANNSATYQVVAYDQTSPITYNSNSIFGDNYTYGGIVQQKWTIKIQTGAPVTEITSFAIEGAGGVLRYGEIDQGMEGGTGTIRLNLPAGTNITSLTPVIAHTGASLTPTDPLDFTTPQTITVKNTVGATVTEKHYAVTVTANKSSENRLLSFRLAGVEGDFDHSGGTVAVQVPYGTNVTSLVPTIELPEFATIAPTSGTVQNFSSPVTYTVTAETGSTRAYTVTVTVAAAAADNAILAFTYGDFKGTVDSDQNTVLMELPPSVSLKALKPSIQVKATSTVSPASGVAQDFSNSASRPIAYTVTAQNGDKRVYQVTVRHTSGAQDEALIARMEALLDKIIARYRTAANDDWEFMNLGFYDHTARKPGDPLPANFDIERRIQALSRSKMTDYSRGLMMFTALGIDGTKLDEYAGKEIISNKDAVNVSNFVKALYEFPKEDTVNGPVFFLNAMNMGRYSVPGDAKFSREKMLNLLLNHEYGTDGFELDMVGMIMQAIAPYESSVPAVKAKLEEGVDIILGKQLAPKVVGMKPGYLFYSTGFYNSEVTAQVICALAAIGIDPHTDPRFSNGTKSVITVWLNEYADEVDGYFHHTTGVRKNPMATYQSCYALQWYINFLKNGGAGHPYSLYYDRGFDFTKALSPDAQINSFTLNGQRGEIEGDKITVKFPEGEPLRNLTPVLVLSPGATLLAPNLPITFIDGVPQTFTIQAEDGVTTQSYFVTVKRDSSILPGNNELDLGELVIKNENQYGLDGAKVATTVASDGVTEILISVPGGGLADVSALRITLELPYRATSTLALDGKKNLDLSKWVPFTVTAANGAEKQYRIKAVMGSTVVSIERFSITLEGKEYIGVIDQTAGTISISGVPATANLKGVVPAIEMGDGVTDCDPLRTLPQDFRGRVTYKVSGGGESKTYTVTVTTSGETTETPGTPVDNTPKIIGFKVEGKEGVIDHAAGTIRVTLDYNLSVSGLTPEVKINAGCTVNPVSGEVVNLMQPVSYTVTSAAGEKKVYTAIVIRKKSPATLLWDGLAEFANEDDYQHSPAIHGPQRPRPPEPTTEALLAGLTLKCDGDTMVRESFRVGGLAIIRPTGYSAAATYLVRADKGVLGRLEAGGVKLALELGALRLTLDPALDSAAGLRLTAKPVPAGAAEVWRTQNGVTGLWNVEADTVSAGLIMEFGGITTAGRPLLLRYNESTGTFDAVAAKYWSVEGGVMTTKLLPAGIYGVALGYEEERQ